MCWCSCWIVLSPEHWQRINDLVRVFVSLLYATKEEMGFDPTVKRVRLNKETCYVYEVNGRFFRTVRSIFHGRVHCITGRKTRVWEAVEVGGSSWKEISEEKNGGKHYALKDVWLDKGSDTEGDNPQQDIQCSRQGEHGAVEWQCQHDGLAGFGEDYW